LNDLSSNQAHVSYLKWGSFDSLPGENTFNLIVGSDIIYSASILSSLAQTISHYLKSGTGLAYIANNKVRYDNYGKEFEVEVQKAGLKVIERQDISDDGVRVMRLLVIKKE
jgi:Lysine methyltransferase